MSIRRTDRSTSSTSTQRSQSSPVKKQSEAPTSSPVAKQEETRSLQKAKVLQSQQTRFQRASSLQAQTIGRAPVQTTQSSLSGQRGGVSRSRNSLFNVWANHQSEVGAQQATPASTQTQSAQSVQGEIGGGLGGGGEIATTRVNLNVRDGAGVGNVRLGTFPRGTELEVLPDATGNSRDGDWVHVRGEIPGRSQPVEGWVHSDYVDIQEAPDTPANTSNNTNTANASNATNNANASSNTNTTNASSNTNAPAEVIPTETPETGVQLRATVTSGVNVRDGAGVQNGKLGTFPTGTRLEVVQDESGGYQDGDWVHVRGNVPGKSDPVEGWVHKDYVNVETYVPPMQSLENHLDGLPPAQATAERAFVDEHIMNSPNVERAAKTYVELRELQQAHPERISDEMVQTLTRGVAEARRDDSLAGAEGILNYRQAMDAADALVNMPQEDFTRLETLLENTGQVSQGELFDLSVQERAARLNSVDPQAEQALLLKSVASRWDNDNQNWQEPTSWDNKRGEEWTNLWKDAEGNNDPMNALAWFGEQIQGMPRDELISRTSVLDLNNDGVDEALQQRYNNSCGPTVAQAMRAELDPIFGMWLNREDIHSGETYLRGRYNSQNNSTDNIQEQGQLLDTYGSFSRGSYIYNVLDNFVDQYSDTTLTTGFINQNNMPAQLDVMTDLLRDGHDVPIRVEKSGSSAAHFMLVSDVRGQDTDRQYLVSDPWTGRSAWVPQQNIIDGQWDHNGQTDDGFLWDGDYKWTSMYIPSDP